MRKQFLVIFVILSTMIFTITLNGCSKITDYREAKKREERQKKEQNAEELQKMLNEACCRKEATLLSIKYKIEEDKVFSVLVETQGFDFKNIQASLKGQSITRSRLNSLAEKYNIPVEILASMLIDYYSMQTSEP